MLKCFVSEIFNFQCESCVHFLNSILLSCFTSISKTDISILSLLNKSRMFEERLGSFRGKGSFHEIINEEFFFSNVRAGYVKQRAVVALFHSFHSIPLKTRIVGHERGKKKRDISRPLKNTRILRF